MLRQEKDIDMDLDCLIKETLGNDDVCIVKDRMTGCAVYGDLIKYYESITNTDPKYVPIYDAIIRGSLSILRKGRKD